MKPIFIAGPCVIESSELLDVVAQKIVAINKALGIDIIFKASFDKANRTSEPNRYIKINPSVNMIRERNS